MFKYCFWALLFCASCIKSFSQSSDSLYVHIPNTFTPNGDGVNDRFYITGRKGDNYYNYEDVQLEVHVTIYDAQGATVFEGFGSNYDRAWTGGDSPQGVYFFKIEWSSGQEKGNAMGELLLLRNESFTF